MNIGTIITPNEKGQIVIPKSIREALKIDKKALLNLVLRGGGIYIYPVRDVLSMVESESSYSKVLAKTQGAWQEDSWPKTAKKRRMLEIEAAKRRRKQW